MPYVRALFLRPVLLALLALLGLPTDRPAAAGPDTVATPHVSLAGWHRRVRLAVWDRAHAYGGLYYDRGVLRRWTPRMDHEYDLDAFVILPSLAEDAAFEATDTGARMSAGSIFTGHFLVESEVRGRMPLGGPFRLDARVVQQEDLSARRAAVEMGYVAALGRRHEVALRHSMGEFKPDLDVELGYRYERDPATFAEAALGRLDVANNLINAVLVPFPGHDDTLRVYERAPVWVSARGSMPVLGGRIEGAVGQAPGSRATVRSQTTGDPGFTFEDAVAYGGVLAERRWLGDRLVTAVDARGVRSRTARRSAPGSATPAAYTARQWEGQAGAAAYVRWRSLRAEGRLARERRTDRQEGTAFGGATVDGPYAIDERWAWGRLRLDWAPGRERGPLLGAEFNAATRTYGDPVDPEELADKVLRYGPVRDGRRAGVRVGWRFSPLAEIVLGGNVDLDRDQPALYDGAYVRLRANR